MTQNLQKLTGLLGMAKRAGKVTIGFDATTSSVESGKCHTILLSADISKKTAKECVFVAEGFGAFVSQLPLSKDELSHVIGLSKPVAVVGITDDGFAKAIRSNSSNYIAHLKEETSL